MPCLSPSPLIAMLFLNVTLNLLDGPWLVLDIMEVHKLGGLLGRARSFDIDFVQKHQDRYILVHDVRMVKHLVEFVGGQLVS